MPLLIKEELHDAAEVYFRSEFFACSFQSRRFPTGKFAWPLLPALPGIAFAQSVEKDKIFQPPGILGAKLFEAVEASNAAHGGWARHKLLELVVAESPCCLDDQWELTLVHFAVVDCTSVVGESGELRRLYPAALCQALQADEQWIAGKRRSRRIRGIAVCGRAKRQNLP